MQKAKDRFKDLRFDELKFDEARDTLGPKELNFRVLDARRHLTVRRRRFYVACTCVWNGKLQWENYSSRIQDARWRPVYDSQLVKYIDQHCVNWLQERVQAQGPSWMFSQLERIDQRLRALETQLQSISSAFRNAGSSYDGY